MLRMGTRKIPDPVLDYTSKAVSKVMVRHNLYLRSALSRKVSKHNFAISVPKTETGSQLE
jgi:hypothetical protein